MITLSEFLIGVVGVIIYFLEYKGSTILPSFFLGLGLSFLIVGSFFSLFFIRKK